MEKGSGKRLFWAVLTIILGILFIIDVVTPFPLDPIPFVDEVVTGLLTATAAIKTLKEFWAKARPPKLPDPAEKSGAGDGR